MGNEPGPEGRERKNEESGRKEEKTGGRLWARDSQEQQLGEASYRQTDRTGGCGVRERHLWG